MVPESQQQSISHISGEGTLELYRAGTPFLGVITEQLSEKRGTCSPPWWENGNTEWQLHMATYMVFLEHMVRWMRYFWWELWKQKQFFLFSSVLPEEVRQNKLMVALWVLIGGKALWVLLSSTAVTDSWNFLYRWVFLHRFLCNLTLCISQNLKPLIFSWNHRTGKNLLGHVVQLPSYSRKST